ncbi:MAG: hypothetical protein PVG83_13285 [Acidimicrobiia bacterium]|jgi:hypothetical protein
MRSRLIVSSVLGALLLMSCDSGEAELSTDSTLLTGGTNAPATTTSTTIAGGGDDEPTTETMVGQTVSEYTVWETIPNENGEELRIVIPNGAYTDIDLENFIIELIEEDPTVYGAEVFDDEAAAEAFAVDPAERTDEERDLLDRHHFVTLVGRERIDFNGPFAEFPGGVIGS